MSCYLLTTFIYMSVPYNHSNFTIFVRGMLLHGWTNPGSQVTMTLRKFIVRSSICNSNCSCFTVFCNSPHNMTALLICSLPAAKMLFNNFLRSFNDVSVRRAVFPLWHEDGFMCSLKEFMK